MFQIFERIFVFSAVPFECVYLFFIDDQWKTVRKSLTPSFTSGKLRELRKFIYDLVEEFGESMNDLAKNNRIENVDIRE
jgi:cytochrome P450